MSSPKLLNIQVSGFKYGGGKYDFSYVVDAETGKPIHEICGFSLISSISRKHKTAQSSKSIIQPLKQFWEDVVLYNDIDWRELSDEEITQYLSEYRAKEMDCSLSTVKLQKSAIQSFYNWSYRYGFIKYPMELDIGYDLESSQNKHAVVESQYISQAEYKKLLANVRGQTRFIRARNEIILMLGRYSGVRTHELTSRYNFNVLSLLDKIKEAESEGETSFDFQIYGKGNKKPRRIKIPTKLFIKLKAFLRDKNLRGRYSVELPLFLDKNGKPIRSAGLGSRVFLDAKNAVEEFTGANWNMRSYHSLRHTYATELAGWCAINGYDWRVIIPPRMGHSHWTTSQIYVEVDALLNNRIEILNKLNCNVKLKGYRLER